ncbi:Metallo-dependent phosphatase-like protein [Gongronella butleri]|nr:Metallo-dependent phosphatase-like protein [Gongronella butleri]
MDGETDSASSDRDTFKILLATDNHLGYLEEDPIRGRDSFVTFEEILKLGKQADVDFILLGGDLFHHNRPSRSCLYQTMRLLRRYCMGDRPSEIWIASDQSVHFQDEFATANYLDANMNVSYPVFSIHGNHDDPNGPGNLCSLHLLSMAGLVNYFGRSTSVQDLAVHPILMQKGASRLALYGLGNVRDERLHRAWRDGHVKFLRPTDSAWRDENCFNMLVLHQNRVKHGPTSYIPEQFLDPFLDLVMWGHEHDCRIEPERSTGTTSLDDDDHVPFITQPGSSVATSLSEGEAIPKHCALLRITGNEYEMEKLPLTSVRPFMYTSIVLGNTNVGKDKKAVQRYLTNVIEDLIDKAKVEWVNQQQQSARPHNQTSQIQPPTAPLPLIRVRVDYTGGYEIINPQQFGQPFTNRVANAKDIVKFTRTRATPASSSSNARNRANARRSATSVLDDTSASVPERLDQIKVEDLVHEFLAHNTLSMLAENELEDAVKNFVDKDDKDAIDRFVKGTLTRTQGTINVAGDIDALTDEFVKRKVQASKSARQEQFARSHAGIFTTTSRGGNEPEDDGMSMDVDRVSRAGSPESAASPPTARRGRGRGRGASPARRATRGKGRATGRRASFDDDSEGSVYDDAHGHHDDDDDHHDEEEDEDDDELAAPSTTTTTTRRKLPATATATRGGKQATRGRGSRKQGSTTSTRATTSNKRKKQATASSEDNDDESESTSHKGTSARRRAGGASGRQQANKRNRGNQDNDNDDDDDDNEDPLFEESLTQASTRRSLPSFFRK